MSLVKMSAKDNSFPTTSKAARSYCLGDRGFSPDYLETIGVDYGVKAVDFGGKYTVRLAFW